MRIFNLSLDDYSPHPDTDNLYWCNKLVEKYSNIKIDLMVPAAFARINDKHPFYLSKNIQWVEMVKKLPDNYSVCLHSMHHRRSTKDFKWHKLPESTNDEFRYLDYAKAELLLNMIEAEFKKVGLKHKKVFRPSAWKISTSATQLLTDRGYLIAGDNSYYKILKNKISEIKWVSYNWNMTSLCTLDKDILAYGHTSSWTNNYMDEERFNLVCDVLDKDKFEFKFIEDFAK